MCGIFARVGSPPELVNQKLRGANAARGPDACKSCSFSLAQLELELFSSELRLRGTHPVVQPHERDGNILCWNGEVFAGLNILRDENDGIQLFDQLHLLSTIDLIRVRVLQRDYPVRFSLSPRVTQLTQATVQKLFFSRDLLGRRSLLIHKPSLENPYFLLTSVSAGSNPRYSLEELETGYIYCLDVGALSKSENASTMHWLCFVVLANVWTSRSAAYGQLARVNTTLPPNDAPLPGPGLDIIPGWLEESVDELISQLDQSVMLQVRDVPQDLHVPPDQPIDLLNVAFENPRKVKIQQEGNIDPNRRKKQKNSSNGTNGAPSAHVREYMVPDRITGLQEIEELQKLCPKRVWNFVEVNVPYHESHAARQFVEGLMSPVRTVMDLSLAIALYFASRGIGQIRTRQEDQPIPYVSPAKVLINGLGSDELLGGYGRHRTAFNVRGWHSVIEELQLEIDRIPARNLGRDDRVISSHGKETRHPFLSLDVVSFLANLPVQYKMDPRLPPGVGDKMLLRLASRKLGLLEASERKKRAMQFGSHSARMEGDTKGDAPLE
ncbi:hypothetical protein D9757_006339 [Collybiopsis confluens]|uniref:Asparagine synthetase domain-containing protein n=1 Tax=Collybiopsis confluens TaxID=2823264 RepID=A0A8H5HGQ4_9AGAR|nr:hypothetical protein D9757_006339 [Collybiopsis confluens]